MRVIRGEIERKMLRIAARMRPAWSGVTAVLTSCDRHDLLDHTLSSFFQQNTYPLEAFIVVEDGVGVAGNLKVKYGSKGITWLSTGGRVGQIAAIDYAYSRVKTPYIFHMEDDWKFYAPSFIERSMQILLTDPRCVQVWIRATDDTNGHPLEDETYDSGDLYWRKLQLNYHGVWHGFSFNPGLRRLADYIQINGYGSVSEYNFSRPGLSERAVGQFYKDAGFHASILVDRDGKGYVRHIGGDCRVKAPAK